MIGRRVQVSDEIDEISSGFALALCPLPSPTTYIHTYSSLDVEGSCYFVFYRETQTSQCMLLITGCAGLRHHAPVCETLTMYE